MKNISTITLAVMLCFALCTGHSKAQEQLTNQEKKTVIDSISIKLNSNYVFPEVATKMASSIQSKFKKGDYHSIMDPKEFSNTLTAELQSISNDKHLRISFSPKREETKNQIFKPQDNIDAQNRYINNLKRNNFGFKEVKILAGNIGYLDLRSFDDVMYAGETAVSAMNFLSNADAIIIDLRFNRGGSPAMIQLISSYLFESAPIHLNNFYWRPSDATSQTWTLPHVPGKRSPETPIFILTSSSTFSAAEEFSYNLKHLDRATLIGETTGGGAHPTASIKITDRFMIWLPTGRAINPITNTNWEGIGVIPHLEITSSKALDVAQIKALELLIEKSQDLELKKFYNWNLSSIKALLEPVSIDHSILDSYVGTYGPRVIRIENNTLYYQRDGGHIYELIPISKNVFELKGLTSFRISFISENGHIIALEGNSDDGYSDRNQKNK